MPSNLQKAHRGLVDHAPIRQTVLSGPMDASGYANFLPASSGSLTLMSQNITTNTPMNLTAGYGFDKGTPINVPGYLDENVSWTGIVPSVAISTITRTGTAPNITVTVNTSAAHGLQTGAEVTHSGVTPAAYNGTYSVTVVDADTYTFLYTGASDPGAITVVGAYTVTNFLGLLVADNGSVTTKSLLIKPEYIYGGTVSTVLNAFTYRYGEHAGYLGNGTTYDKKALVVAGECQASTATITSTIAYLYNGYYDSGWTTPLPPASTKVIKNNNLGYAGDCIRDVIIECLNADAAYSPGIQLHKNDIITGDAASDMSPPLAGTRNTSYLIISTTKTWVTMNTATLVVGSLTLSKWKYKIIANRGW